MEKVPQILLLFLLLSTQVVFAQNHKFDWLDYSDDFQYEYNREMLIDDADNNYTFGIFNVSFDADPGPGVETLSTNGDYDCFIRKMDADKNLIWALSFGSDGTEELFSASVDSENNIIAVGTFVDTMDVDPGPGVFELYTDSKAYFIQKLDSSGAFLWGTAIQEVFPSYIPIYVESDGLGNVYVGGAFLDSLDFDPGPGTDYLVSNGVNNGYLAKYSPSGNLLWKIKLGGDGSSITDFDIDSNNDILVSGVYLDSIDFDPGIGVVSSITDEITGFVLKLSSNADFLWVEKLEGSGESVIENIELGIGDTIHLYGHFQDTVDFDPGVGIFEMVSYQNLPFSSEYIFLSKFTPSGDFIWAVSFGGSDQDHTNDLYIQDNGDIYITGGFDDIVDFDPDPSNEFVLTASGGLSDNLFYSMYTGQGDFVWVKRIQDYVGAGNAIDFDSQGALYLASGFSGNSIDFDPGYLTYNVTQNEAAHFLLKLEPCIPSATTDTVVVCNGAPYTWINGFTYNTDNTSAKMVLEAANGCDSIVSLNLTFNNPTGSTDVITACNSYTWINGTTYTSNNSSATFTYSGINGCDSTVSLDLTIIPSDTVIDAITSCGPYTWIDGNTYASSNNTAEMIYTNINGCDSVVKLNLTVATPTAGIDIVSSCESYSWIDGNVYTASNNTATFTTINSMGCDSVVTLNLTILPATTGADVITACDSYTWIDGTTYTNSNNSAQETILNVFGCDSTVTLDLTVHNSSSFTDVIDACESYTWVDGVTYTASNNSAVYTIVNAVGCDSIITLDLTINSASAVVTNLDPQLVAAVGSSSYQWLDCLNGNAPIAGATNNVFVPSSNGEYAVVVEENGCLDTSACFVVGNVGVFELNGIDWKLHPNPTNGDITLTFSENPVNTVVEVINPLGQIISEQWIVSAVTDLELGEKSGVYFIRIVSESDTEIVPVVKL